MINNKKNKIDNQQPAGRMFYLLTNHLGSITGLVGEDGTLAEEYSYDAWGCRRYSETRLYLDAYKLQKYKSLINRGYTCHEQIDRFEIINLNGRLYDPETGQMLSLISGIMENHSFLTFFGINSL